jgi:hypothetical protein
MLVGLSPQYQLWMFLAWAALLACLLIAAFLRPWRSRRKPIRTLFKLSFSVWILAFFAVLAETLFVSLYSTTDAFSLSLISQRWNDRFVHRNNWNCRDDKRYEGEIPPGTKRLAIIGDSFAFGHGIRNIEDLVPGTYEIVGSIINDPPRNFFCRNFYLPNFLYYRMNHFRRPEVRGYFGWLKDGYTGEVWEKQKQRLDQIKNWCDERKAKLVVVVFPFMVDFRNYAFESAHHTLTSKFASMKVPVADLLPVYRKLNGDSLVVGAFDAHPNETAHRIAAEEAWARLLKDVVQ